MKTLNVMDLQFNYKAALRGYESIILNRLWNGIGSLAMTISSKITNADLITQDDILWFDQEYKNAYIVEKSEEARSGNTVNYEVTAISINSLLKDYITIPPSGSEYDSRTGTREAVVRAWVDENCINPEDASRIQYLIALGDYMGQGSEISEQSRFKTLTDEINRVLMTEDLGYGLVLDIPNKQFIFNVYEGVNRTSLQNVNSRILFGLKYGNVSDYKKVTDATSTKNVIYVGGKGEGTDRTIVKVTGPGTRMRETFVDARDSNLTAELIERGNQKLMELAEINNYEFETIERQFIYGKDYDLGDYVTVVISKDNLNHLQLQKVKEVYEGGKMSIVPEFGQPEKTITSIVSSTAKRISSLETEMSEGTTTAYNLDGGKADSNYGGIDPISGGGA